MAINPSAKFSKATTLADSPNRFEIDLNPVVGQKIIPKMTAHDRLSRWNIIVEMCSGF